MAAKLRSSARAARRERMGGSGHAADSHARLGTSRLGRHFDMSDKPELRPSGEVRASREVRASDSERQAVVGRLNLHGWDEGVALAYRANTHAELEQLAADLPPDPASVAVTKPPAKVS